MKIAILTFHRANNFGAMLQAYSLVMKCRELGADAELLDWRNPFFEKIYHKAWRMHRNPIPAIKHLIWYLKDEVRTRKMFASFRDEIPKSKCISDRKMLDAEQSSYDIFIAGSDQIWNPKVMSANLKRFDKTFFLDFVKSKDAKKYAYAASFGDDPNFDDSLQQEFTDAWESFDKITTREEGGADYISMRIGKPIDTVVDPVFLHDEHYWRRIGSRANIEIGGKFILLYNLRRSTQLSQTAHNVAKEKGLMVADLLIPAQCGKSSYPKTDAGPLEFLKYIDKAEYVFTGSFHAAAFSIIFGKKLYVQLFKKGSKANSRMENLFSLCDLSGTKVSEDSNSVIMFYDCSLKDSKKLEQSINNAMSILKKMSLGEY
jgi:hypothetical protein